MFWKKRIGLPGVDPNISFSASKRRVSAADVFDLRRRILRAGLPIRAAYFEGDDDPRTWHVASYVKGLKKPPRIICCASFMFVPIDQRIAFQLRGMATEDQYRGRGWGRDLLSWGMEQIVKSQHVRIFWCNARKEAVPFYQKLGWGVISEEFDIPTAGPHFKMKKSLG